MYTHCVYIYIHRDTHVYIDLLIFTHAHLADMCRVDNMYIYANVAVYVYTNDFVHVRKYVCMYVCMYVVCMYVCMGMGMGMGMDMCIYK